MNSCSLSVFRIIAIRRVKILKVNDMKKTMMLMTMLLVVMTACAKNGKELKTVVFTTLPVMHCENCENKIKGNLRFEKGVKEIETNVDRQRVIVKYDPQKTSEAKLQNAFKKFGYQATVVTTDKTENHCDAATKDEACEKGSTNGCGSCENGGGQGSCCQQATTQGSSSATK